MINKHSHGKYAVVKGFFVENPLHAYENGIQVMMPDIDVILAKLEAPRVKVRFVKAYLHLCTMLMKHIRVLYSTM